MKFPPFESTQTDRVMKFPPFASTQTDQWYCKTNRCLRDLFPQLSPFVREHFTVQNVFLEVYLNDSRALQVNQSETCPGCPDAHYERCRDCLVTSGTKFSLWSEAKNSKRKMSTKCGLCALPYFLQKFNCELKLV